MGKKTIFWLVVILIIAGFLRFYHLSITPPGLYPDEAMNGSNALRALQDRDFKVFYPTNNGLEGLFSNTEAMLIAATGANEPWVLRLTSALFGFFTVLGLFFLTRELFHGVRRHNLIALLSSFFLATSFWHITFSRIGFRAIMAPFFLVWGLYFFLKSIRGQKENKMVWFAGLGGVFFGLGLHSYISYRIMPLLLLLTIPFFHKEKNFWKLGAIFCVAAFIVALPLGLYYLQNPADFLGRTSQVSVFSSDNPALVLLQNTLKTIGMLNFEGDHNWRHNFAGQSQLFWPIGISFWVGSILAIRTLFRRRHWLGAKEQKSLPGLRFAYALCFMWIALAAMPVVLSNEGIPHALRAILMIPPIMILAGSGAVWIYDWLKTKLPKNQHHMFYFGGMLILSLLVFEAGYSYFIRWANNPNVPGAFSSDYATIGRQINALPPESPKVVLVNAGGVGVQVPDPWSGQSATKQIPVPAQTVMFLTNTYTAEGQLEKNLRYVLPEEEYQPGADEFVFRIN